MKPSLLKPNPGNPRVIKDDKFQKLVQSLKSFPEMATVRPVVIDENNVILGGNMRLKAMLEAGWDDIPVTQVKGWTEEQKREFIIKDNVQGGEWDWDILANSWDVQKLEEWGVDLPKDLQQTEVEEDEAPEVSQEPPISKLGEVYQLGRHRLMCGDSTKIEDVEKLMDGKKADMVFTDPPYGVDYSGGIQFTKDGVKTNQRDRLMADDKETSIYSDVVPLLALFCNGPIYTWFSDTQVVPVYQAVKKVGDIHALIVWVKNGGYSSMNANYKQKHEPCLYWKAKGKKLNFVGPTTETTIWNMDKDGLNKLHPTQKPVALAHRAIMNHSAGLVLDLFGGSGSTLIACEQTNRTCYMMELDPKYTDVIRKRYAKFIGKEEQWQEITPAIFNSK